MNLTKPGLDVGMFVDLLPQQLSFWSETVGLRSEPMQKLGGGVHQHRFVGECSVIKLNHSRSALPSSSGTGIERISVGRAGISESISLNDPDGNAVAILPRSSVSDPELVVHMAVSDLAAHHRFWTTVMQMERDPSGAYCCGQSRVQLTQARRGLPPDSWRVRGWSYLTVQIQDCAHEHQQALLRGGREGEPPRRMGDKAIISFLRDPDGNFIELSQKASLAGPLPESVDSTVHG
ncbi:VOC family protein [Variovorax paradoxus]|nr:VOC family protein [Variovorax paradoxus]